MARRPKRAESVAGCRAPAWLGLATGAVVTAIARGMPGTASAPAPATASAAGGRATSRRVIAGSWSDISLPHTSESAGFQGSGLSPRIINSGGSAFPWVSRTR